MSDRVWRVEKSTEALPRLAVRRRCFDQFSMTALGTGDGVDYYLCQGMGSHKARKFSTGVPGGISQPALTKKGFPTNS